MGITGIIKISCNLWFVYGSFSDRDGETPGQRWHCTGTANKNRSYRSLRVGTFFNISTSETHFPQWLWQLWANVGIWMSAAWSKRCHMRQRKEIVLVESDEREICGQKSWANVPDIFTTSHKHTHTRPHINTEICPIFLGLNISVCKSNPSHLVRKVRLC